MLTDIDWLCEELARYQQLFDTALEAIAEAQRTHDRQRHVIAAQRAHIRQLLGLSAERQGIDTDGEMESRDDLRV